MRAFHTFIFGSYSFDPFTGKIELNYSLDDDVHFTETLTLPSTTYNLPPTPSLDRTLFALHLIGGMSYYKTCVPKIIEVRSGSLTKEQAAFWNTVYEQGLGEFFYKNKMDPKGRIQFPSTNIAAETHHSPLTTHHSTAPRLLVPVGGGKDSAVTIELLRKGGFDMTLLRVGGHPLIERFAEETRKPLLTVKRALSPALFDLNAVGALNGHVPISAYLSFLAVIIGELQGFTHVVFSSERSANEGNVKVGNTMINHQWSKSIEFERMLQDYLRDFVTGNVQFFSLLRPLSELHIMQLFSTYPQYFDRFTSCNQNWKIAKVTSDQLRVTSDTLQTGNSKLETRNSTGLWCNHCPKCAFTFGLLSAFLPREQLLKIFGDDLFADETLLPLYRELLGLTGIKPFECVGTPEEMAAALLLADERGDWDHAPVLEMFHMEALDRFPSAETIVNALLIPSKDHAIPEEFLRVLPA